MYSPSDVQSKVCQEEFNIAWAPFSITVPGESEARWTRDDGRRNIVLHAAEPSRMRLRMDDLSSGPPD
jgi:hypothetical protein